MEKQLTNHTHDFHLSPSIILICGWYSHTAQCKQDCEVTFCHICYLSCNDHRRRDIGLSSPPTHTHKSPSTCLCMHSPGAKMAVGSLLVTKTKKVEGLPVFTRTANLDCILLWSNYLKLNSKLKIKEMHNSSKFIIIFILFKNLFYLFIYYSLSQKNNYCKIIKK
jgi:hypothetical protein